MWHDMFVEQIPLLEKVLRTVFVYALIVILIRIGGKRGLAALNNLDIVVMFLLSNVVQNAIIGNDLSVTGAIVGASTLIAVNALLNRLSLRSPLVARIFDGTDTTVIEHGTIITSAERRLGLRRDELEHAVHIQNGDDVAQVRLGVLEASGQLLLTLDKNEQGATKGDIAKLAAQLARIEQVLARG